jgi:O-antigen/teichoic acid export membrane protein
MDSTQQPTGSPPQDADPEDRPTLSAVDGSSPSPETGTSNGGRRSLLARVTSRVLSDGSLTKKASLNAVASTTEQVARVVAGLVVTPFLVTRLGDVVFGIWQVLQRLIGHASPAGGRPGEALKWTVAHAQASTDYEWKRRQVGNAVAVWFLFLPLLTLIGGFVAWFSPSWLNVSTSSYTTVRVAAAILVVDAILFGLFYLPQSVLQGENLGYKRLGLSILLVLLAKAFLVTAVFLGAGLVGMALATAAGTVLWGAMYLYIGRSRVAWFGIARPSLPEIRGFVGLSWWFLLWNLVMTIMLGADVVVLGVAGSPELVTTYTLARYLPQAIALGVATLIFAIMPGLGGLIGAGDLGRAVRIRNETMSLVWLMTVVAGATVLLWEKSFLRLWVGERYYPGAATVLMIMLMVLQFAIIRTDSNIIDLTLKLRGKVLLGSVSAALSVGLSWLFIGFLGMGITGLVIGFMIGRAILSVAYPSMIGRMLGIPPQRQVVGMVRPVLATSALFVLSSALGATFHAGSWIALVLSVGVSAGVIAILAFFAGLSAAPRRHVWKRLRRVARLT